MLQAEPPPQARPAVSVKTGLSQLPHLGRSPLLCCPLWGAGRCCRSLSAPQRQAPCPQVVSNPTPAADGRDRDATDQQQQQPKTRPSVPVLGFWVASHRSSRVVQREYYCRHDLTHEEAEGQRGPGPAGGSGVRSDLRPRAQPLCRPPREAPALSWDSGEALRDGRP